MADRDQHDDDREVDPVEFIKAMLRISKEDAADVRKIAAERTARGEKDDTSNGDNSAD